MYHRHDEKGLNWELGGVRSGVVRIIRDLGSNVLPAVPEAVAVAVHLQDMDVVGERSSSAPVRRSEPNTSVHSSKGRLVVTRMEPGS